MSGPKNNGRTLILKWILDKPYISTLTGFNWLRIEFSDGLVCEH
jgi:hypothetical protein